MNLQDTFNQLRSFLTPYEKDTTIVTDNENTYYLNYKQDDPKAKPEMFAAVMVKKNYVSMYYMPVYTNPELLEGISPELKKHMQGKSCFNFKSPDDDRIDELQALIEKTAPSRVA